MRYQIGDKIAHPLHGAGAISGIENKRVNGQDKSYYILNIAKGDMRVMIPTDACDQIGIRPVVDAALTVELFSAIPELEISEEESWNRRYRENMLRLRSGDLMEVAVVIKSLDRRETACGLSNGERKMLHNAKQILISEVMLSRECSYDEAEELLTAALVG